MRKCSSILDGVSIIILKFRNRILKPAEVRISILRQDICNVVKILVNEI